MLRHFLIRYKDEHLYVKVKEKQGNKEALFSFCFANEMNPNDVLILETCAGIKTRRKLTELIGE